MSRRMLATTLLTSVLALAPLSVTSSQADDNTISTTVTTTNGGFNVNGDDSLTVDENGAINTTAAFTRAIEATGNNNIITNKGTLSTSGDDGYGLLLNSSNNNGVTNSGSISTSGGTAYGIRIIGSDDNSFTNSGSISTSGNDAYGLYLSNNNNSSFTNSGSISTSGTDAYGLYLSSSDNNIFDISGRITAAQGNAIRLSNTSDGNIFNLTTGAFLGGAIDLGTGGNLVNISTTPGHSAMWDFGAGSTITNGIQVSGIGAYLVNGNVFFSVDPTGFLARADAIGDTAGMLAGIANSRLGSGAPADFEQPSGFAYTHDDGSVNTSDARFWGDFIASASKYGETNTTLGYNSYQYGVALGYERDFDTDTTYGLMGGYLGSQMKAESRFTTSQETKSRGGYIGLYGARSFVNEIKLSGSLMAGRSVNESLRTFNNNTVTPSFTETATGTYDSNYIAPSISISKDYVLNERTTLTPILSAIYAHQWSSGYTETGSSNNLTVGSGQSSVFEGRAELGLTKQVDAGESHQGGQITARLGAMVRDTPSNELPTLSFAGIGTLSTASNDRGTLYAATAGLDFNFDVADNMALTASGDIAIGNNSYYSAQGKIGFKVKF